MRDDRLADPEAVLEAAGESRMTVVIGDVDVGKTTLVTALANGLLARGFRVGIVDADVGQSEIGPPTTIGLGRVVRSLERPRDAELVALRFVGATSAARDVLAAVVGTASLAERAHAFGLERIVVDTSGLVRGDLGRRLKQAKIDRLGPDIVVALQREGECEPILRRYDHATRPRVFRMDALAGTRQRTPDERRRHRERALAAHFAGSRRVTLDPGCVTFRSPALFAGAALPESALREAERVIETELVWGEWRIDELVLISRTPLVAFAREGLVQHFRARAIVSHALEEFEDVLAGLDDTSLETLGLGVVRLLDFGAPALTLDTCVSAERIASVTIGRERYSHPRFAV